MGGQDGNRRQNFLEREKEKKKWRQQTFLWGTSGDGWLRLTLARPGGGEEAAEKADGRKKKRRDRPIGRMIGKGLCRVVS